MAESNGIQSNAYKKRNEKQLRKSKHDKSVAIIPSHMHAFFHFEMKPGFIGIQSNALAVDPHACSESTEFFSDVP